MIAHALRVCTHHAMMFTRTQGECMYQREWSRERASADEETEHKTLFGLFFTLKDFAKQLDPLGYVIKCRCSRSLSKYFNYAIRFLMTRRCTFFSLAEVQKVRVTFTRLRRTTTSCTSLKLPLACGYFSPRMNPPAIYVHL